MAGHIYGGLLIDDLECNKAGIKGEGTSVWNTKVVADLRVLIRLLNARYWLYSHPSFYGFQPWTLQMGKRKKRDPSFNQEPRKDVGDVQSRT